MMGKAVCDHLSPYGSIKSLVRSRHCDISYRDNSGVIEASMKRIVIISAFITFGISCDALAQSWLPKEENLIQRYLDGYWQKIEEPEIIDAQIATYQKRMRSLGIAATVHSCRMVSQIARGTANGSYAIGALCSISIGSKAKRDFWVCENTLGSFNISDKIEYALDYETSKEFIGRTCWVF